MFSILDYSEYVDNISQWHDFSTQKKREKKKIINRIAVFGKYFFSYKCMAFVSETTLCVLFLSHTLFAGFVFSTIIYTELSLSHTPAPYLMCVWHIMKLTYFCVLMMESQHDDNELERIWFHWEKRVGELERTKQVSIELRVSMSTGHSQIQHQQ